MTDPVKSDIDALARRLPRRGPAPEQSAAMRRAVLEGASHARPGRSRIRFGAVLAAAVAVAAVWAVITLRASHSTRPDAGRTAARAPAPPTSPALGSSAAAAPTASSGSARASDPAPSLAAPTASRASDNAPRDRLAEGITTIESVHPVQLAQGGATLTAPPGARFDVEVRDARVVRVAVKAGWVVLASTSTASASTTMIAAETTWIAPVGPAPVRPTPPSTPVPAASLPSPATVAGGAARGPAPLPSLPAAHTPQLPAYERMPSGPSSSSPAAASAPPAAPPAEGTRVAENDPKTAPPAPPPPPPPAPSAESEQAFHHGLRALLSGEVLKAAKELDRACAPPSTIQQDACYWAAVAWRRAGDRARARSGFADIVARWPRSPHAGEASVGLGWLLLEAGDRAEARLRFAAGVSDPTSSVREDALRGLSAAR